MDENKKIVDEVLRLYDECKRTMGVHNFFSQSDVSLVLPNADVQRFYVTMTDFFLQEKQMKILKERGEL